MGGVRSPVCIVEGIPDYSAVISRTPYPEAAGRPWMDEAAAATAVYWSVRECLAGMGLDRANYGTREWNPLGDRAAKGGRVVIKPNMVRHWNGNPGGTWRSVVTNWAVVRPLVDYALLAVGESGRVTIGDAPHWDCDIEQLRASLGVAEFLAHYERKAPGQVQFVDFRREWFSGAGPVKTVRHSRPGDPKGYVEVDLGPQSTFCDDSLNPALFCASEYDNGPTVRAHSGGRHAYLISRSCLDADLFINVPKLKTHHLLGITVAMKNLVGINGDKNRLPHFRTGFADEGGDQFPERSWRFAWRRHVLRTVQPLLIRSPLLMRSFGHALGVFHKLGGRNPYAGGSWIGNDTIWRTTLDLNRILLWARADGSLSTDGWARRYLTIVDGVIAGEGEGPMEPDDVATGAMIAADNPLHCDAVAARVMGFDPALLKLVRMGFVPHAYPISQLRRMEEIEVTASAYPDLTEWRTVPWRKLPNWDFKPSLGYQALLRNRPGNSEAENEEMASSRG